MPVPILKQGSILIACIQPGLSDHQLLLLKDKLSGEVERSRAEGVVIDVSAIDVMDSFATRTLRSISQTTRLRGARTVVVGIQPDVAFAMIQLGLTMEDVSTALDLEEAVAMLTAGRVTRRGRD